MFRGHTVKRSAENTEIIQTDTVAVGQFLAHVSHDSLTYMQHILCRHATQSLDFFRDAFQVIHLRVTRFSFQGIHQRRSLVSDLFVALCTHYQCCRHNSSVFNC